MNFEDDEEELGFFRAFKFPLSEPAPVKRLWWVLFFAFLPVFDFIIFRGWRLAIVRRMTHGADELLPGIGGFPKYCLNGIILWAMTALYALPGAILLLVFGRSSLIYLRDIGWWLVRKFVLWQEVDSIWRIIGQGFGKMLLGAAPAVLFIVLIGPAYRAGMLRYAAGDGLMSFLNFPKNVMMVLRNPAGFYGVWALDRIFAAVWLSLGVAAASATMSVAAASVILLPVAPVLGLMVLGIFLSVYYWTTGYLYGDLATQIRIVGKRNDAGRTPQAAAMLPPTERAPSQQAGSLRQAPAMGGRHCVACGTATTPGLKFCTSCGNAVG